MSQAQAPDIKNNGTVEALLTQIHERTFGRLHDLNVAQLPDGRLHISAVAHSRFVGQLAEWAILELMSPEDVILSIRVLLSTSPFSEDQK